jgi:hypothetical protein
MDDDTNGQVGLFIAYPTSSTMKSIFSPKGYKATVNRQHTKIGITKRGFKETLARNFVKTFDGQVEILPVALIAPEYLDGAKAKVRKALSQRFPIVDETKDWFHSSDHNKFKDIIGKTLAASGIEHEYIGDRARPICLPHARSGGALRK